VGRGTPTAIAIDRTLRPAARSSCTWAKPAASNRGGRPIGLPLLLPWVRTRSRPAFVRSLAPRLAFLLVFDDALLAQSAVNRFKINAYDVVVDGESYRARLKPNVDNDGPPPFGSGDPAASGTTAAATCPVATSGLLRTASGGLDATVTLWQRSSRSSGHHLAP
jgi:hypothetical protein